MTGGAGSLQADAGSDTAPDAGNRRNEGDRPAGSGRSPGENDGSGSQSSSRTYPAGHKTPAEDEHIDEAGIASDEVRERSNDIRPGAARRRD
jgi:hypothetical protein